jgi:PelA/Pel-15E family pectate lyase
MLRCIMAGLHILMVLAATSTAVPAAAAADDDLRAAAQQALRRAVEHFRGRVGFQGGYLWRYSEDLALREGEGKATATMAWVQPPGTPSVGEAYLRAHEATGDALYLDAAREVGEALARGQLRSGGWDYKIELDPEKRRAFPYRLGGRTDGDAGWTTLDDDTTQSAVRFLLRLDRALGGKDGAIRDALLHALDCLLKAQYPHGGWPQRFVSAPDPARHPVRSASYPDDWPRTWPKPDYRGNSTLNDGVLEDMVETMFLAARTLADARYEQAARRVGEFLLRAQMPDPQPAWAQQYDAEMHPAWARKFEPPAVTGGESQGAVRTLFKLYRATGDERFLEPVPRALDYLRRSRLPGGRLARFYELGTNRPLYFTREYALTHMDNDLPTHYAFTVADRTDSLRAELEKLRALPREALRHSEQARAVRVTPELEAKVRGIIAALDERGAWVEEGQLKHAEPGGPRRRIIDAETFARNVEALCSYLIATRR